MKPEPRLKHPLDVTLASIGLLLSSPIWLLTSILIVVDSGLPVFYRQERWGRGRTTFAVTKFRTMRRSSEQATQAEAHDPRVTRVGRILRASGIDELPQLLSVVRGEMSLVGPRALAVGEKLVLPSGELVRYEELPGFEERLQVKPGLTGLATVYLPKDVAPIEKFQADLRYIREQSLWLDIRLIVMSLWISFRGRWEARDRKF